MNMSNSAEMTTVGGRFANNSCGALSGKSTGESHWASRSCERYFKLCVMVFYLSKSLPAGLHSRNIGALLLRHGGGGGGEEVVRQHGNYRQGQLHLQVQSFHSIHGHGRYHKKWQIQTSSLCFYLWLKNSPVQFDHGWPDAVERKCKHTCS